MNLYDVKSGSTIRVLEDPRLPPDHQAVEVGTELRFCHIDGAYSLCYTGDERVHLAAWTEVEVVS